MRGIAQDPHGGSDPDAAIFRREALEHRAEAEGPGAVVRIAPRWTTWAFYGLVLLVAAMILAVSLVPIDRYAAGVAATDPAGRLVALIPAASASEVPVGNEVDLGATRAEVVSWEDSVLDPSVVRDRFGVDVSVPSIAIVTSARASEVEPDYVRVLVESERLIVALIPGLKQIFGGEDA